MTKRRLSSSPGRTKDDSSAGFFEAETTWQLPASSIVKVRDLLEKCCKEACRPLHVQVVALKLSAKACTARHSVERRSLARPASSILVSILTRHRRGVRRYPDSAKLFLGGHPSCGWPGRKRDAPGPLQGTADCPHLPTDFPDRQTEGGTRRLPGPGEGVLITADTEAARSAGILLRPDSLGSADIDSQD